MRLKLDLTSEARCIHTGLLKTSRVFTQHHLEPVALFHKKKKKVMFMAWRSSWNSIHLCLHIIWSNIGFFWMPEKADVISAEPQICTIKHAAHSQVKFSPACWELGHRPGRMIWKVICAWMHFNNSSFHALQFHLECIFHCGSHNKLSYWLFVIKGLL